MEVSVHIYIWILLIHNAGNNVAKKNISSKENIQLKNKDTSIYVPTIQDGVFGKLSLDVETYVNNSLNPVLQNSSAVKEHIRNQFQTGRSKRSSDRKCSDQCTRSLCPWSERWDEDSERVPMFIKYALCDSPTCNFEFDDLGSLIKLSLSVYTQCEQVRTNIEVKENGRRKLLTNWPIACVCTRRRSDSNTRILPQESANRNLDANIYLSHQKGKTMKTSDLTTLSDDLETIRLQANEPQTLSRASQRKLKKQLQKQPKLSESWEQVMVRRRQKQSSRNPGE